MHCNCVRSLRPPTTTAVRTGVPTAILTKVSLIWIASSRVGLNMRARTPERDVSFSMELMIGRTNASVFPVPVWAVATTSRPASAGSIDWACTAVGSVKPFLNRLLFTRAERVNSEKLFIYCRFLFCGGKSTYRLPVRGGLADQHPVDCIVAHSSYKCLNMNRWK